MDWYPWIVVAHVIGAFAFVLAHGVSAFVAFRLRRERRADHVAALLELSGMGLMVMYPALLLLLLAGVVAGFVGDWWGELWIWVSIGILVAVATAMFVLGTRHYHAVRQAVAANGSQEGSRGAASGPAAPEELDGLLRSSRPIELAIIGGGGLGLIVWLMEMKPF